MSTITTAAELDALPPLSVWIDCTDSIGFRGDSGLFCLPQIGRPVNWRAAQEIIDLCADYGALPLTVLYRPDQPEPVKPSREDVARAINPAAFRQGDLAVETLSVEAARRDALVAADAVLALLPAQPTVEQVWEKFRTMTSFSTPALRYIAYERATHAERGWTAEHDAEHGPWHLIDLTDARLQRSRSNCASNEALRAQWVKAASLLVAAIDLLDKEENHG